MNEEIIGFPSLADFMSYMRSLDNRVQLKGVRWTTEPADVRMGQFLFIVEDLPYEDGFLMDFICQVDENQRMFGASNEEFKGIKLWLNELQQQDLLPE